MSDRRKIIIDNQSLASDCNAMDLVKRVILEGRVSNGGYCYVTKFKTGQVVVARKNKASDSFLIMECHTT